MIIITLTNIKIINKMILISSIIIKEMKMHNNHKLICQMNRIIIINRLSLNFLIILHLKNKKMKITNNFKIIYQKNKITIINNKFYKRL